MTVHSLGNYGIEAGGVLARKDGTGLGWIVTVLFIVTDLAGSGIVALPKVVVDSGFWPGFLVLALMTFMTGSSGVLLGKAWLILLRRFPVYRTHCRKPYAEMGFRVGGQPMKIFVSICLNITNFGASVVFLLLCAENIDKFVNHFLSKDDQVRLMCHLIPGIATVLLPVTLLKSPLDFSGIIVCGMLSTVFAVVLICVGALLDVKKCAQCQFPALHIENTWLMLGTVLFSYGGHSAFPTIQHDMRRPSEFTISTYFSFTLLLALYAAVVGVGGWAYGDSLGASIIDSVSNAHIQLGANLLITLHCLLSITLILNPVNQEVEELFGIPQDFGALRLLTRTATMAAAVVVGLLVPKFDAILGLLGGSTITFTSLIFPPIFFLALSAAESRFRQQKLNFDAVDSDEFDIDDAQFSGIGVMDVIRRTKTPTLLFCGFIIVIGITAGIAATYMGLATLSKQYAVTPCYWPSATNNMTAAKA